MSVVTISKLNGDILQSTSKAVQRRFSEQTIAVLECILEHQPIHGYEIVKITNYKGGTVYPILKRLSNRKLITSEWDLENKPPKRKYKTANPKFVKQEIENALFDLEIQKVNHDL